LAFVVTEDQSSFVIYEKVLTMIASWCQPEKQISQQSITHQLDSLAHQIFNILVQKQVVDCISVQNVEELRRTVKTPGRKYVYIF
jgi:hypothetical protein